MTTQVPGPKQALAYCAAKLVPSQGTIGLGSGTTASAFITALAERFHKERLDIMCVAASIASETLARSLGLPIADTWSGPIDYTFDGADIAFEDGSTIKGLGAALVREKIIAAASHNFILMIEEYKWHRNIDILPIALIPFGYISTINTLSRLGCNPCVRQTNNGTPLLSDDGLMICDCRICLSKEKLVELDSVLHTIPGVVETGLFYHMATSVIIADTQGVITHHTITRNKA